MPTDPTRNAGRWDIPILLVLVILAYLYSLTGWFYGDDAVTLLDAASVLQNPAAGFGPGTFGRFRPLRLFSAAAIYSFAGTRSAIPYHLLSLAIHTLNVLLTYRLMRRLLGETKDPVLRMIPFVATALAAVHWAGSEAVTYLSAIGILFSTTGTLIGCLALRDLAEGKRRWSLLKLAAGMAISIGGGYVVPTILVLLVCALWPSPGSRRLSAWTLALAASVVFPLAIAYGAIEKVLIAFHNFEKQANWDLGFIAEQYSNGIAKLFLPSSILNEPIVLGILAAALAGVLIVRPLRAFFLQPRIWLLLAISLAAMLPYAPSALGNRDRFCYLPAAFFMAFWLLIAIEALRLWQKTPPKVMRGTLIVCGALLIAHIVGLQLRVKDANQSGDALKDFVARVNAIEPGPRKLRVFMVSNDVDQGLFMLQAMGVIGADQRILGAPLQPWPPEREMWVIASYRKKRPFEIRVLPEPGK
jgi:hypothetical protein